MFEFIDTPNPNAKKIMLDHEFDIAIYLNEELIKDDSLINLFNHPGVENIFSGPGFLTLTIIFVLPFIREQRLIVLSLILLGGAVALVGHFPFFSGLMITTLISSIGFHYFEAAQQTLQLQWLDKKKSSPNFRMVTSSIIRRFFTNIWSYRNNLFLF